VEESGSCAIKRKEKKNSRDTHLERTKKGGVTRERMCAAFRESAANRGRRKKTKRFEGNDKLLAQETRKTRGSSSTMGFCRGGGTGTGVSHQLREAVRGAKKTKRRGEGEWIIDRPKGTGFHHSFSGRTATIKNHRRSWVPHK